MAIPTTFSIPYIIPLFLGMTFDARSFRPGVQIFDDNFIDYPLELEQKVTKSNYEVVEGMKDILKTLDISGDLALKIKNGLVDVKGKGSFLKNDKEIDKSVIILATFNYTARVKTFHSNATAKDGWAKMFPAGVLGTHYVSSMTYGVDMIAVAKFVAHNSSDLRKIKGDVQAALRTEGDAVDLAVKGKLDNLAKTVSEKARLEISYYGTLPLKNIPNSIEGLRELIQTFDQQIIDQGLIEGIPREVQLSPLTGIADPEDVEKFRFVKDESLQESLEGFENKFNELNSARKRLILWGKSVPFDISPEDKDEIGTLLETMNTVLNKFHGTLWNLELDKGPEQLDKAVEAYKGPEGTALYNKYTRKVNTLIRKIEKKVDVDAYAATGTYVHWGNSTCDGAKTIKMYDGYTVSSTSDGIGGAAEYSCLPLKVDSSYDINKKDNFESTLAGIRYADVEKGGSPFKGGFAREINGKGVPCAMCYSSDAASITMLPADDSCPPTWDTKYTGYLMSSKNPDGHTTEYICVDDTPTKPLDVTSSKVHDNLLTLTQIQSKGMLPEKYSNGQIIKCVVCALKSPSFI